MIMDVCIIPEEPEGKARKWEGIPIPIYPWEFWVFG